MADFKSAYLIGGLLFGAVWLVFFLARQDLRREMLSLSFLAGIMGPISEHFYLKDYWQPQYWLPASLRIEDFLAGFFLGGISAVGYEVVWRKRHECACWLSANWILPVVALLGLAFMVFLFHGAGLNSIYSSILSFLAVAAVILFFRRDLISVALGSGMVLAGVMFVFYIIYQGLYSGIISAWWRLENISGILILGVPVEELAWGFSWGMVGGSLYEFAAKTRIG